MGTHGGNLQAAKDKYGNLKFLDFSANINPLGPPQGVYEAIGKKITEIIHYPEPQGASLKKQLAEKLAVSPDNLILGNGAVELVYLLAHGLQPNGAVIPAPTFSEYSRALEGAGSQIRYTFLKPENGFRYDLAEMDFEGCDILFICNPNNPTGGFMSEGEFVQILEMAKSHGTFVVVDESFMDFVELDKQWRANKYLKEYDKLFVIYSLTKFYAIPGLRLGCGIATPEIIAMLDRLKDPWNVNNLALAAGEAALLDVEYAGRTRQVIKEEREFLVAELQKIPCLEVFPGTANFLLVRNHGPLIGDFLVDGLGEKGILIRNCHNFPGLSAEYFRIAVKDRASNTLLVNVLNEILG